MNNQEAIRLIRNLPTMCEFTDAYGEPIDSDAYYEAVDMAISALNAQEANNSSDLISRQAAIDAALSAFSRGLLASPDIRKLPSAQPEKLTDKEQRIFLSAMGREEEVCKEVDDAWRDCREPYEDSLVHVCKEIRRKVKGALWT